jgi:carboxylate-amine ligase
VLRPTLIPFCHSTVPNAERAAQSKGASDDRNGTAPTPRTLDRPDQAPEDSRVDLTDVGAPDVGASDCGPAPWLLSAEHNDETVAELITSGAMLDQQMVYWYARLSPRYPTIEVRIGDVFPTVDDTVLAAAITRALVRTAVEDVRRGRSAQHIDDWHLQAAYWRAARDGVDGAVLDLEAGGICPGWELVDRLVDRVRPALEELGDLEMVRTLVARMRASGSGAARQRSVFAASSDLRAVADFIARQTLSGLD